MRAARIRADGGAPEQGVPAELLALLKALRGSRAWRGVGLIALGLVLVVAAVALGQIRLNTWQGAFFDALSRRELHAFFYQTAVFAVIVAVLLVLVVFQTWLVEILKVRLRGWLTSDLLDRWLAPARAYRLELAGEIGQNPDQRLHEDARKLTDLTSALGVGLLQSSFLLISFIGVLWVLSEQVVFQIGGDRVHVPGYMVWCALLYAGSGSVVAWAVGRPLIRINTTLYAREAELRFGLVRVSEAAEGIALYRGEADERAQLQSALSAVLDMMTRRVWGLAKLTWVTSGYGWLAIVVPVLVAAPGYFAGDISFGTLMMVVGAFNQVQQSLRWFVDNVSQIADWRATLHRVMALRNALDGIERAPAEGLIAIVRNDRPVLELRGVNVRTGPMQVRIAEGDLVLDPGDCVVVGGRPGAGKSMLFRAIAGIWPWGSGEIRLPANDRMLFLPNRPYLPPGTLRNSVAYPLPPENCKEDVVRAALNAVGLSHLCDQIGREARWDRELALDEQQRLAFARVLLHRPDWLLTDDAGSSLGTDMRRQMFRLLRQELPGTAMLAFEREEPGAEAFHRSLHMEVARVPDGASMSPIVEHEPGADDRRPAPIPS